MIRILRAVGRLIRSRWTKITDLILIHSNPEKFLKLIGVRFGKNVRIWGLCRQMFGSEPWMITLGDNVYITSDCLFVTHDGGTLIFRKDIPDLEITAPIVVGNDVYIGVRSIIMPGVRIGNRCIIGAGSIVTKDIPDNSVAAGIPARVIKSSDEYLEKLKQNSLHLGHLSAEEKAKALKEYFHITHI
jgi:acetyltransferase-like isoleucine patch superfamily enzyme